LAGNLPLHDPEEDIVTFDVIYIINRILDKRGEGQVSMDLNALREELLAYPDLLSYGHRKERPDTRRRAVGRDMVATALVTSSNWEMEFHPR